MKKKGGRERRWDGWGGEEGVMKAEEENRGRVRDGGRERRKERWRGEKKGEGRGRDMRKERLDSTCFDNRGIGPFGVGHALFLDGSFSAHINIFLGAFTCIWGAK